MSIYEKMDFYGHEELVFARDEETGLKAIIAIHDTTLGPALGGTRMWNYESEEDALYDVLRLSRGMSLKNAGCGLKNGGGKAVIIGDPRKLKNEAFFKAYGRFIESLAGRYYTAEDVNINTQDIAYMQETTKYVTGTREIGGNPSPYTARGTFMGIKAGIKEKFGADTAEGLTVVVQGLGSVGYMVAKLLHDEGAILKVYDINPDAVKRAVEEFGATPLNADEVLTAECDIFAPCALGAVINSGNAKALKCKIVGGCANNVLVDPQTGEELEERGILYLPDYIINAGGVINCGEEIVTKPYDASKVTEKVDKIYDTTLNIIHYAKDKGITTYEAADHYAMDIIKAGRA